MQWWVRVSQWVYLADFEQIPHLCYHYAHPLSFLHQQLRQLVFDCTFNAFVMPCEADAPGAVEKRVADIAFRGSCSVFRGGARGGGRVPRVVPDWPLPRCRIAALSLRLPRRNEGMLSSAPGVTGCSRAKRVCLVLGACCSLFSL